MFSYINYKKKTEEYAILIDKVARITNEPLENSSIKYEIHSGIKIHILDKNQNNWIKIRLPNEQIGWILPQKIEII